MTGGRRSAAEAVTDALRVIDAREGEIHAWASLDPDLARAEARRVDRHGGPLAGLTLGVKDIFDTAEWPTSYGTPIYAGHRPTADAAVVRMTRAAGAACLGKTVTAELACYTPGPTTNPHRPTHTPGGSSSGSAAAVAAGMCEIALGTQTAGSVIRPAAFCGVFGFKPTFGVLPVTGMKVVAPSLDTVGWFARSARDLEDVRAALLGGPAADLGRRPPTIGVMRGDRWDLVDRGGQEAVEQAALRALAAGATVRDVDPPAAWRDLTDDHAVLQSYEAARSLAGEARDHAALLSPQLRDYLARGAAIPDADHHAVLARRALAAPTVPELFGHLALDVMLTPAVVGEAPGRLDTTGDPVFCRPWTLLGLPTVAVPGLVGPTGLPIGVQLVAAPGHDALLTAWAGWLGDALSG